MVDDRRSLPAMTGLALFAVSSCFTVMGSMLLIMECVAVGFIVSLVATVLSTVGVHDTIHHGRKGLGIAFWTLLLSLGLLAYTGVITLPWLLRMLS
ncbi:hypothetical protein JS528_11340 [Bifidobacterium sp. MA2]|uniref:Uncharacterized protein n=1 Tax=Bifidobacterium santillanense TaxID=2809028 RepID=A0ABS5USC3_9BIFI|nr:hypothetical protein [Bifidobacterium santillanense]MBT1173910.1 hypothetical protein [Bifidobacterium santillanense]